jgi:16S rRNA (cytosine967-C5)-methyltransferase
MKNLNVRALAAMVVEMVLLDKEPLNKALQTYSNDLNNQDKSLLSLFSYGILRNFNYLDGAINIFLKRDIPHKHILVKFVLACGIYQLAFTRIAEHAAVNETINAIEQLEFNSYKGLANAILRNFIRNKESVDLDLNKSYETKFSFPQWMISKLKLHYGKRLGEILENSNKHPPMWIRVNTSKCSIPSYINLLKEINIDCKLCPEIPCAIELTSATDVYNLPLFKEGVVFIQDAAAQYASILLEANKDDIVLDCCCAPGGKTTHINELYPNIKELVALDSQDDRLTRVADNLTRLNQKATLICYDASAPAKDWSPYQLYDKILLDAPCSATGVIRRHPDIKWLRTEQDIIDINMLQNKILQNMWSILKPGGILVYATCSIMPEENAHLISNFLKNTPNAKLYPFTLGETIECPGMQRLPGENNMDGFYYARLKKEPL